MKLLLDVYKGAAKDIRDKVEVRISKKKKKAIFYHSYVRASCNALYVFSFEELKHFSYFFLKMKEVVLSPETNCFLLFGLAFNS